jgi:hypothetical protein
LPQKNQKPKKQEKTKKNQKPKNQNKMSAQKLWVAHETSERTFGPLRVSTQGCEYVADFKVAIRRNPELSIPSKTPITLYQPDGITEIKPTETLEFLQDAGKAAGDAPLIVRIAGVASRSKASLVLHSNLAEEDKESIIKDIWEVQAKQREVQDKQREVQDKVALYELLKEKAQRIEAERDYLKGTLDARHIFETYELRFQLTAAETFGLEHRNSVKD